MGIEVLEDRRVLDSAWLDPHGLFPGEQFPVGSSPVSVTAADLNGDGKPEILTTDFSAGQVSVLTGGGDGTFHTHETYQVGAHPHALAVADLNGDGIPDLVTANRSGNNVSVFFGRGDGKFETHMRANTGYSGPKLALTLADLDGDGILDVVTGAPGLSGLGSGTWSVPPHVGVLLGFGDGTFASPSTYLVGADHPVGANPRAVVVADVNGDGILDLISANYQDDTVSVLLGNGDGTFEGHETFNVGKNPTSVAVADVNGDGVPDLVTANEGVLTNSFTANETSSVSVLLGRGDGTFEPDATYAALGWKPETLAVGDINGDGLLDLVTAGWSREASVLLRTPLTHSPAGRVHQPVQSLTFRFPTPMDTGSFSLSEDVSSFTGPDGSITPSGFTWINNRTLRIQFPLQTVAGDYDLVLSPSILDVAGNPLDEAYQASFAIAGPYAVAYSPTGRVSEVPVHSIRFTFNRAMDPDSFSLPDGVDWFLGPDSDITPMGFSWLTDRTLEIEFEPQWTSGMYVINLGPTLRDTFGNDDVVAITS
ncbi:MAG: VCBS repeat-containing protein, partial [Planctomycetaceae bacterium]